MGLKEQIGPWSFIAGLIIALVFAFLPAAAWTFWVLGVIGIAVGLLNITDKEIQGFLIAAIAFVVSANSLVDILKVEFVGKFLVNVQSLMAPAAAIVAIIALYKMAKD